MRQVLVGHRQTELKARVSSSQEGPRLPINKKPLATWKNQPENKGVFPFEPVRNTLDHTKWTRRQRILNPAQS